MILAVGPEGGFTPAEVDQAASAGWIPINLGVNTVAYRDRRLAGVAALFSRAEDAERMSDVSSRRNAWCSGSRRACSAGCSGSAGAW